MDILGPIYEFETNICNNNNNNKERKKNIKLQKELSNNNNNKLFSKTVEKLMLKFQDHRGNIGGGGGGNSSSGGWIYNKYDSRESLFTAIEKQPMHRNDEDIAVIILFLKMVPLLNHIAKSKQDWEQNYLPKIARYIYLQYFDNGDVVFTRNHPSNELYIVAAGSVCLARSTKEDAPFCEMTRCDAFITTDSTIYSCLANSTNTILLTIDIFSDLKSSCHLLFQRFARFLKMEVNIFRYVSVTTLQKLQNFAILKCFMAYDTDQKYTIIEKGHPNLPVGIVLQGYCWEIDESNNNNNNASKKKHKIYGYGQCFGVAQVISNQSAYRSIYANNNLTVLFIDRHSFNRFITPALSSEIKHKMQQDFEATLPEKQIKSLFGGMTSVKLDKNKFQTQLNWYKRRSSKYVNIDDNKKEEEREEKEHNRIKTESVMNKSNDKETIPLPLNITNNNSGINHLANIRNIQNSVTVRRIASLRRKRK